MTDAESLAGALRAAGLELRVEARDRLALLTAPAEATGWDDELRVSVVRMAREHGFTHVALECGSEAGESADIHRD